MLTRNFYLLLHERPALVGLLLIGLVGLVPFCRVKGPQPLLQLGELCLVLLPQLLHSLLKRKPRLLLLLLQTLAG